MLALVPITEVPRVWLRVEDGMEECARQSFGRYDADAMYMLVLRGEWQLWVATDDDVFEPDLALVTTLVQYPTARALQIIACAGRRMFAHIDEVQSTLRRYARDQGCSIYEVLGRRGWGRLARRLGDSYESTLVEGFI